VRTIYSVLGDWVVWLSITGLAALLGFALQRKTLGRNFLGDFQR
jgi:hypothetical protein